MPSLQERFPGRRRSSYFTRLGGRQIVVAGGGYASVPVEAHTWSQRPSLSRVQDKSGLRLRQAVCWLGAGMERFVVLGPGRENRFGPSTTRMEGLAL